MTAAEKELRRYLQITARFANKRAGTVDWPYRGPYNLLLKEGRFFTPQPVPERWAKLADIFGAQKQCYDNAYKLAQRSRGALRYVEGVATTIIPVDHAWCIDADDAVIDPTWTDGHGRAYFGVEIPAPAIRRARVRRSMSALYDWTHEYPMCREPYVKP